MRIKNSTKFYPLLYLPFSSSLLLFRLPLPLILFSAVGIEVGNHPLRLWHNYQFTLSQSGMGDEADYPFTLLNIYPPQIFRL